MGIRSKAVVIGTLGEVSIISQDEEGYMQQQTIFVCNLEQLYYPSWAGALNAKACVRLRHRTSVQCYDIQFSPSDDQILLAAYKPQEVTMWNIESQSLILSFQLQGTTDYCFRARFGPAGTDEINVMRSDGTIECWLITGDVASHSRDITTGVQYVGPVSVTEDGSKIALAGTVDGGWDQIAIIRLEQTTIKSSILRGKAVLPYISCLQFNSSATIIAAGYSLGAINLWDIASCQLLKVLNSCHNGSCVTAMCFLDKDRYLYSASRGRLWVWDLESPSFDKETMEGVDDACSGSEANMTMAIDGHIARIISLSVCVVLL